MWNTILKVWSFGAQQRSRDVDRPKLEREILDVGSINRGLTVRVLSRSSLQFYYCLLVNCCLILDFENIKHELIELDRINISPKIDRINISPCEL